MSSANIFACCPNRCTGKIIGIAINVKCNQNKNDNRLIFVYCPLQTFQDYIYRFVPAGLSLGQILHYMQLSSSRKFQQFDYDDANLNIQHYGQSTPPEFDLTKVTTDIYTYKSDKDTTTPVYYVKLLEQALKNVKGLYPMEISGLSHTDFIYGNTVVNDVYTPLIANMKARY